MREIELKFDIAADAEEELRRSRLLRGVEPRTRSLRAIYFDTPDHRLAANGMALRVRREGERWVQTLKGGGGVQGALHSRDEYETERPDATLDLAALKDTPAAAVLRGEALGPVFEVSVERTTWCVSLGPSDRVEVALDLGHVRHGRKRAPIREVEIESVEGDPAAVFEAAERLLEKVALHSSSVSKAQRGYALARGEPAAPRKAVPVALARNASLDTAARRVIAAALTQMQANAPHVPAGDDEYLHQFRVGLRRLRAAVRQFAELFDADSLRSIRADGRWLSRLTGEARDWDVFAAETLDALEGDARVKESVQEARAAARARLAVALGSTRYAAFALRFTRWLARPAHAVPRPARVVAARALERQHRKALRALHGVAALAPGERHRVRIRLKRLRYACDALASLFAAKDAEAYIDALAQLQKVLGAAMDARVAMRLVKSVEASAAWRAAARAHLEVAEARSLEPVERQVAALRSARPFWRRPSAPMKPRD